MWKASPSLPLPSLPPPPPILLPFSLPPFLPPSLPSFLLHTHRPIIYANMSTRPIAVTRAQSGWFFRVDKTVHSAGPMLPYYFNIKKIINIVKFVMYMFTSTLTHMHTEASVTCGTSSGTCVSGDSCSQTLGVNVDRSLPTND